MLVSDRLKISFESTYQVRLGRCSPKYFSSFEAAMRFCNSKVASDEIIGLEERSFVINQHGCIVGGIVKLSLNSIAVIL